MFPTKMAAWHLLPSKTITYASKVKAMRAFKMNTNIARATHTGSISEAVNTSRFTSHLTNGDFQ